MYQIIMPNSVKKDMKKLDKAAVKLIIRQLEKLSTNPRLGTRLSGDLSYLFKLSVRQQKIEYRVVYKIIDKRLEIHLIHIGTRENFYDNLRRRL
ncbi:MAG: type II toxin-antitoxin system mRNA interferase toxin, RelE/StbE family [Firmicutes bacterium]|nr:type II toxin-antitoxin system mRNA interferase toxin, RelE/StbE family [Bacillota bacterium]